MKHKNPMRAMMLFERDDNERDGVRAIVPGHWDGKGIRPNGRRYLSLSQCVKQLGKTEDDWRMRWLGHFANHLATEAKLRAKGLDVLLLIQKVRDLERALDNLQHPSEEFGKAKKEIDRHLAAAFDQLQYMMRVVTQR